MSLMTTDSNKVSSSPLAAVAAEFLASLASAVSAVQASGESTPLYEAFGASAPGPKMVRIFSIRGESKSSRCFVMADGTVRRSDSWKAAGRVLGHVSDPAVLAYVLGPRMSAKHIGV